MTSIRNVEIFKSGTHNGDEYTAKDLDAIVSAFKQLDYRPALKLGHTKDAPGAPAYGWVQNLRRVGQKLYADFVDMHDSVVDAIRKRLYDHVSAEVYFNLKRGGKTFPRALKAVALLGAEVPAVAGLVPLHKMDFVAEGFDGLSVYTPQPFTFALAGMKKMTRDQVAAKCPHCAAKLTPGAKIDMPVDNGGHMQHICGKGGRAVARDDGSALGPDSGYEVHEAVTAYRSEHPEVKRYEEALVAVLAEDPEMKARYALPATSKYFPIIDPVITERVPSQAFNRPDRGAAGAEVHARVLKLQRADPDADYTILLEAVLRDDPALARQYSGMAGGIWDGGWSAEWPAGGSQT